MVGIHEHNSHTCMLSEKMPLLTRMFLNAMVPLSICMLLFCFTSRCDHRVLESVGEAITQLPFDWVPKFILFFPFAVADTAAAAVSCRCGPQGAQVS
jgi:hypothetical protein